MGYAMAWERARTGELYRACRHTFARRSTPVPVAELAKAKGMIPSGIATLETAEREHIERALREANWIIGGPAGAATRLGMKRTTLQSKLQKLGISRP